MYVYDDEDNAAMNDDPFLGIHNPTVYLSRQEMKAEEHDLPFTDDKPDNGCWNCLEYNCSKGACMLRWNNNDPDYYNPELDDREPDHMCCDDWQKDPDADPEDFFGHWGNEP